MTGLTSAGFVPATYEEVKNRIEGKVDVINPGFDLSPESPDGQTIKIMTYEIALLWQQLNLVYHSNNPQVAIGAGLRNIGLISGTPYGAASRSFATLETQGVDGTLIPRLSIVTDDDGNEFYTSFDAIVPSNIQVVSREPGIIDVSAGKITTIKSAVVGWSGVTHTIPGTPGKRAMTEQQYKNYRQSTVMRNHTSEATAMRAKLVELGLGQANVLNNSDPTIALPDGTPANTVHVTVGEVGEVQDEDIARTIMNCLPLGCPTFGNTTIVVKDDQGVDQSIKFSKALSVEIEVSLDVNYLSTNTAGANSGIKTSILNYVNSLVSGRDVYWSRMFAYITPFAEAEILSLTIGVKSGTLASSNVVMSDSQFATLALADISLSVNGVPE